MSTTPANAEVLDFGLAVGLRLEFSELPVDPERDAWRVVNVLAPGFDGPPLHVHRHCVERCEVLSGVVEIFADGCWQRLEPGESAVVPRGKPHTLRNHGEEQARLVNIHEPGLDFPRFIRRLHGLVQAGKVRGLPPRDPRSMVYLSMLFTEHERELVAARPPAALMNVLAFLGHRLRFKLDE